MNDSVYCLFGVINDYDQPNHDLYCVWKDKPTLDELQYVLNISFKLGTDEEIVSVVKLFNGSTVRIDDVDYRLEKVNFGSRLAIAKDY